MDFFFSSCGGATACGTESGRGFRCGLIEEDGVEGAGGAGEADDFDRTGLGCDSAGDCLGAGEVLGGADFTALGTNFDGLGGDRRIVASSSFLWWSLSLTIFLGRVPSMFIVFPSVG